MNPLRRIGIFFALCLLIYAVLVIPWPGVMTAYRACFCGAGNALFASVGHGGSVTFESIPSAMHEKDTRLTIRSSRLPGAAVPMEIDSAYLGYRPIAFLVALTLATPVAWRRRWRALLWGLVLVNVFVAVRVSLPIIDVLSRGDAFSVFAPGPLLKGVLGKLTLVLFRAPATTYTAPAFIWLLVTFRRDDLKSLLVCSPPTPVAADK